MSEIHIRIRSKILNISLSMSNVKKYDKKSRETNLVGKREKLKINLLAKVKNVESFTKIDSSEKEHFKSDYSEPTKFTENLFFTIHSSNMYKNCLLQNNCICEFSLKMSTVFCVFVSD